MRSVDLEPAGLAAVVAELRAPFVGTLVALEPLAPRHQRDLAAAAAECDWRFMPMGGSSRQAFVPWLDWMLANAEREPAAPFAVVRRADGRAVGSTHFHAIHPEHRRLEIGMTWYARSEWGSGANVETKLLMLGRAFALGFSARRVQDGRTQRALAARARRASRAV